MAKNKKASGFGKLNVFANSPKSVKAFSSLVILLMVVSVGYGGYTLISEQFGNAAKKYRPSYYNSRGIKHRAGKAVKDFSGNKAWRANPNDLGYVWYGPYVKLPAGKQYLGCFMYTFQLMDKGNFKPYGKAEIDIVSNANNNRPTEVWRRDIISSNSIPQKEGTYNRTCLSFYVHNKKNEVELRVKHMQGYIYIRKIKIVEVPRKKNKLPGSRFMKKTPNNSAIFHDKGYRG